MRKIGHDRQYFDMRERIPDAALTGEQMFFRDIDRYVGRELMQMFQQQTSFMAGTTAELDKAGLWADHGRDISDATTHDAQLGRGQVILGELRYLVEQARAGFVVEVFWRN